MSSLRTFYETCRSRGPSTPRAFLFYCIAGLEKKQFFFKNPNPAGWHLKTQPKKRNIQKIKTRKEPQLSFFLGGGFIYITFISFALNMYFPPIILSYINKVCKVLHRQNIP